MFLKFSHKWSIIYLFSVLSLLTLYACQKDHVNPYDEQELPDNTLDSTGVNLDPTSFDGLHANIFSKTCARSIGSSDQPQRSMIAPSAAA